MYEFENTVDIDTGDCMELTKHESRIESVRHGAFLEKLSPGAALEVQTAIRRSNIHEVHAKRRNEKLLKAMKVACVDLGVCGTSENISAIADEVYHSLHWLKNRQKTGYGHYEAPPVSLTLRCKYKATRGFNQLWVDWSGGKELTDCEGDSCYKENNCWSGVHGGRRCKAADVERYLHIPTGYISGFEDAVTAINDVLETYEDQIREHALADVESNADDNKVVSMQKEIESLQAQVDALQCNNNEPQAHLYLMRDNRNGRTKIGYSKNPKFREKTLQSEVPDVWLIFSTKEVPRNDGICYKEAEKFLHNHFKAKRIRGEWFDLTEGDIQFIKKYANDYTPTTKEEC